MSMTKRLFEEVMVDDLDFLDEEYQYQQFIKEQQEEMELDFIINTFFCNN